MDELIKRIANLNAIWGMISDLRQGFLSHGNALDFTVEDLMSVHDSIMMISDLLIENVRIMKGDEINGDDGQVQISESDNDQGSSATL